MTPRILVVDDDQALAEMIGIVLRSEGYEPEFSADGNDAVDAFHATKPDLVLLDVMLPGIDGIEVCKRIRAESGTPIIMLTAKGDTADVVAGLENGADDYVVKPFNPKELVARIRTRLRPSASDATVLHVGDLTVDVAGHEVRRGDAVIALTPLEFDLLRALAEKPNQVFTREMLLEQVWGYHYKADTRLVNVHVQRLRAKIEHDPDNPKHRHHGPRRRVPRRRSLSTVPPSTAVGLDARRPAGPGRPGQRRRRAPSRSASSTAAAPDAALAPTRLASDRVPVAALADVPLGRHHRDDDGARGRRSSAPRSW